MEELITRYSGPGTVIQSYMTDFVVECPKCKHQALVTAGAPNYYDDARLNCQYCTHTEKASELIRYKISVRSNCDDCGKLISKVIPHSKEKVDAFALPCPSCGEIRIYRARNDEYHQYYNGSTQEADPIFHLPLWFQDSIKKNVFWAYNREHLHDIKVYISSKLRERQTSWFGTMVEMLPTFIKEARNRESLLHLIEKLERK
jgi:predicted RNA-binding Zn-ribbon protein involved in translation (DUF1610 family)